MTHKLDRLKLTVARALDDTTTTECDACGLSSDNIGSDALIEHALFDHVSRAGLKVVRHGALLSSFELSLAAGLEARTDAEQKWRDERAD